MKPKNRKCHKEKLERLVFMTHRNKKMVENSEIKPYDILPNYNKILILKFLKAAQRSGAPINNETIENIEKNFIE